MKEKRIGQLIKLAKTYSKKEIPWHHHYITPRCRFNKGKKFQIILENEKTKESFFAKSRTKPLKQSEVLENLFYKRKKAQK